MNVSHWTNRNMELSGHPLRRTITVLRQVCLSITTFNQATDANHLLDEH